MMRRDGARATPTFGGGSDAVGRPSGVIFPYRQVEVASVGFVRSACGPVRGG